MNAAARASRARSVLISALGSAARPSMEEQYEADYLRWSSRPEHVPYVLTDREAAADQLRNQDCGLRQRRHLREAFDPRMMIALLAYAYCGGVRSSRAIERACHTDVAFRVVLPSRSLITR